MEELRNEMKNLFKGFQTDESDKYLHFSPKYRHPVKIANWFLPQEAYPKDNDPYDPPGGNYFASTYRRLGAQEEEPWETTTQSMLRQICTVEPPVSVYRPMVNFASKKLLEENPQDYEGLESEDADFVTTYNYDYRHPFPYVQRYPLKTVKSQHFGIMRTPNNTRPEQIETKFLDDYLLCPRQRPPASSTIPR